MWSVTSGRALLRRTIATISKTSNYQYHNTSPSQRAPSLCSGVKKRSVPNVHDSMSVIEIPRGKLQLIVASTLGSVFYQHSRAKYKSPVHVQDFWIPEGWKKMKDGVGWKIMVTVVTVKLRCKTWSVYVMKTVISLTLICINGAIRF